MISWDIALNSDAHIEATLTPTQKIGGIIKGIDSLIGMITVGGCGIDEYRGDYEVLPSAKNDIVLDTDGKKMSRDVTVFKIPYYETANLYGDTAYIG